MVHGRDGPVVLLDEHRSLISGIQLRQAETSLIRLLVFPRRSSHRFLSIPRPALGHLHHLWNLFIHARGTDAALRILARL